MTSDEAVRVADQQETSAETADEGDIRACFRLLLGRSPSAEEWAGHSLLAGTPLVDVVRHYLTSLEFQARGLSAQTDQAQRAQLDGYALYAYGDDVGPSYAFLNGIPYEPHVTALVRQRLRNGSTFLDIGANVGYFTLLARTLVGPTGRVIAVEPAERNVRALRASLDYNDFEDVRILLGAASSTWRLLSFGLSGTNGITGAITRENSASGVVQGFPLDAALIDEPALHLVKIDVEGAEYDALLGMRERIVHDRPAIIAEFGPPTLQAVSGVAGETFLSYFFELGYTAAVIEEEGSLSLATTSPSVIMGAFSAAGHDHVDILFEPVR